MTHIHVEDRGAVRVITIDRPERFNSMDVETARDFRRAGLQAARDTAIRAVVLRGVPKAFCSGADLKFIRHREPAYGEAFKEILEYLHSAISEIRRAPKPFIAAVDGMAAAGGFGLAMSCDLVFASPRATFEWAYGKTGLTGAESSTFLLPRLIGLRRAMELMLLNPRLGAYDAVRLGLVTRVLPQESFDAGVLGVAREVAEGPTRAYGVAKALINQAAGVDRIDFHLDQELQHLVRSANSPEFKEGLRAFFEKRPAAFTLPDSEATRA